MGAVYGRNGRHGSERHRDPEPGQEIRTEDRGGRGVPLRPGGRDLRLPRAERRREDHHHPLHARPHHPDRGGHRDHGPRRPTGAQGGDLPGRLPPGRIQPVASAYGGGLPRLPGLAPPAASGPPRRALRPFRALPGRPPAAGSPVLPGDEAEGRHHPGLPTRTSAGDHGRAHRGTRPRHEGALRSTPRGAPSRRGNNVPLVPHPVGSGGDGRPGRGDPGREAGPGGRGRRPHGRAGPQLHGGAQGAVVRSLPALAPGRVGVRGG